MTNFPKRMWINQPSTQQPLHHRHGTNVLAVHEHDETWSIFFLSGETVSMQASKLWLSEGWRSQSESEIDAVQAVAEARFCIDNPDVLHTPPESRRIISDLLKNISRDDERRHHICVCPDCVKWKESDELQACRLEIKKVMQESQALFRLKNNYLNQSIALNRAITQAIGCFEAAVSEGLEEAILETEDERLRDLIVRRVSHALPILEGAKIDAITNRDSKGRPLLERSADRKSGIIYTNTTGQVKSIIVRSKLGARILTGSPISKPARMFGFGEWEIDPMEQYMMECLEGDEVVVWFESES